MSKKNDSLALLPNGFADLLPPDAEAEAVSIRTLMEKFYAFGYQRIKPPLLEFEDSLLAPGPGERLASETFRVMDPVSHRMLGIRSDITAQVSRIVSSRLKNEPRPLRLRYANDVLRTRGSQIRTGRQFVQVGCEIIGESGCAETDIEICVLSLIGLKSLGLGNLTIDLTIPGFVAHLTAGLDEETREQVNKCVAQRDVDALEKFDDEGVALIALAMVAPEDAREALDVIQGLDLDEGLSAYADRLLRVCNGIYAALSDLGMDDVSVTIDLLEQCGFEYHKALGFTLFSTDVSGELGRGGCYDICFGQGDDEEVAKGFTLYMDTISKGLPALEKDEIVFVPCDAGWSVIAELQEQGWGVLRGVANGQVPDECTHIYKDGKIENLS